MPSRTRRAPVGQAEFVIGGVRIEPGTQHTIPLPIAPLYTHTEMAMPVRVIRGKSDGPRLFVSGAIHGDEINGVEIVRRLLGQKVLNSIRGTLIAVPVVNVYGFTHRSRYLPDRRDLNRSFPGSSEGSMAARIAHTFIEEVVTKCSHGIDLHTGAIHRSNLPHVRVSFDQSEALQLAHAFRVPLVMHSNLRDGSLREAVIEHGVTMLLYEGGEALRFDESTIVIGVRGILSVMRAIGMLPKRKPPANAVRPVIANDSRWIRAPESGSMMPLKNLGDPVVKGEVVCVLTDPMGDRVVEVKSSVSGLVVGRTQLPLVYAGEALFNIARLRDEPDIEDRLERFEDNLAADIDRLYR